MENFTNLDVICNCFNPVKSKKRVQLAHVFTESTHALLVHQVLSYTAPMLLELNDKCWAIMKIMEVELTIVLISFKRNRP